MTNNRIELLAPAGNLEILKVAIDSGADSVYLGLKEYSARAGADNFTLDELEQGVDYAHLRSSKVFLAVNTLMSDSEFELFYPTIAEAVNIGVDGLIVQDLAVLHKLAQDFPDVIINASTQMNIYSADEFKKLSEIIYALEINVQEDESIKSLNYLFESGYIRLRQIKTKKEKMGHILKEV